MSGGQGLDHGYRAGGISQSASRGGQQQSGVFMAWMCVEHGSGGPRGRTGIGIEQRGGAHQLQIR